MEKNSVFGAIPFLVTWSPEWACAYIGEILPAFFSPSLKSGAKKKSLFLPASKLPTFSPSLPSGGESLKGDNYREFLDPINQGRIFFYRDTIFKCRFIEKSGKSLYPGGSSYTLHIYIYKHTTLHIHIQNASLKRDNYRDFLHPIKGEYQSTVDIPRFKSRFIRKSSKSISPGGSSYALYLEYCQDQLKLAGRAGAKVFHKLWLADPRKANNDRAAMGDEKNFLSPPWASEPFAIFLFPPPCS